MNATYTAAIEILKTCKDVSYEDARRQIDFAVEALDASEVSLAAIRSLTRARLYGADMRSSQQLNIDDAIAMLAKASGIFVRRTLFGEIAWDAAPALRLI